MKQTKKKTKLILINLRHQNVKPVATTAVYEYEPFGGLNGDEFELLIPIFDGAETKMNVRCSGLDTDPNLPTIVYFHGYSGQGLDFSWGYEKLRQDSLICIFDRVGAGFSRNFKDIDEKERKSDIFAIEYLYVFEQLENNPIIGTRFNTSNLLFIGHSMAGLNMRAVEITQPGIVKGMIMVDPVFAEEFDLCDPDEITSASPTQYIGESLVDSGFGMFFKMLNLYSLFGLSGLPSNRYDQYINGIMRADYFTTSIYESRNWGKNCFFVLEGYTTQYEFPLVVIIPENGIFAEELDVAQEIQNLAVNGTTVFVEDSDHTEMVFVEKYADVIIEEARKMLVELA
eukprot:snap_masked-scaffold_16-processed-gene-6.72-mRNA-1 protein AED:1.00 eAED:1.00 QI:0/0/0/0/1/1/2/0/341